MLARTVCLSCCLLALNSGVRAGILPDWRPKELLPSSCLVVLAKQTDAKHLTIQKVFKGSWPKQEIEVSDLHDFRRGFDHFRALSPYIKLPKLDLTDEVVVFVSLKYDKPKICANGVFRLTGDGTVLGYAQEMNPGPYELQPEPVYQSLGALVGEIEAAKISGSKRQADFDEATRE